MQFRLYEGKTLENYSFPPILDGSLDFVSDI